MANKSSVKVVGDQLVIRLEAGDVSQEHRAPARLAEMLLRGLEPLIRDLRKVVREQRVLAKRIIAAAAKP